MVEKGGGREGRWLRREVVEKGGGREGRWQRREVVEKGGGGEERWLRRGVVEKGGGERRGIKSSSHRPRRCTGRSGLNC